MGLSGPAESLSDNLRTRWRISSGGRFFIHQFLLLRCFVKNNVRPSWGLMCAIKGNIPLNNGTIHPREATCAGYGRQVDIDIAISVIQMISFGREASLNDNSSRKTYNII